MKTRDASPTQISGHTGVFNSTAVITYCLKRAYMRDIILR